jgi:hypothetical protein
MARSRGIKSEQIGVSQLSTDEIVTLADFLASENPIRAFTRKQHRRFERELRDLPLRDADAARRLTAELAQSDDPSRRTLATELLPRLTEVDDEFGRRIWTDLLYDRNYDVYESACARVNKSLGSVALNTHTLVALVEASDVVGSYDELRPIGG